MRHRYLTTAAVAAALFVAGCGSEGTVQPDPPSLATPTTEAEDTDTLAGWVAEHDTVIEGIQDTANGIATAADEGDPVGITEACEAFGDAIVDAAEDTESDMPPPPHDDTWQGALEDGAAAADACLAFDFDEASVRADAMAEKLDEMAANT